MEVFNTIKKEATLHLMGVGSSVMLGVLLFTGFLYFPKTPTTPAAIAVEAVPKTISIDYSAIIGKAAVIYDPTTGRVLYSKNADVTMPLASITKLMTAQVALNNIATNTLITLSKRDVSVEGDAADWNLKEGDTIRLGDIIKLGLTASSNHAMSAAASALGDAYIGDLNKTASELGLTHTYFLNSTGLDLNTDTSGAYGSASDIAKLAAAFMKDYPAYFEESTNESVSIPVSNRVVTAKATSLPLLDIPGIIGAKTGYTDLAGGNLVAAFEADVNHPLIAVVLGSTEEGRFIDIRTLIKEARAAQ
jgi:D-alanyl-D-alanine carboxypeptidase (penicillin-binding protein 5/6)